MWKYYRNVTLPSGFFSTNTKWNKSVWLNFSVALTHAIVASFAVVIRHSMNASAKKKRCINLMFTFIPAAVAQHSQISRQQALFFKFQLGNTIFFSDNGDGASNNCHDSIYHWVRKGDKAHQVEKVGKLLIHIFVKYQTTFSKQYCAICIAYGN